MSLRYSRIKKEHTFLIPENQDFDQFRTLNGQILTRNNHKQTFVFPHDDILLVEKFTIKKTVLNLTPYSGSWDSSIASHLLRRVVFGPKVSEIKQAVSLGLQGTLDQLLDDAIFEPGPPLNYYYADDPHTPIGETFVDKDWNSGKDGHRRKPLRGWAIGNFINHPFNIQEKMTTFWINHFATEADVVADARAMYGIMALFRTNCLGNFKTLVEEVTVNQAMLYYLNGNSNQATAPNENYARELLELFSIGKGPLIEAGNYTNYTEDDIQEAAKVLSGFTAVRNPKMVVEYKSWRHDKTTKQFSSAFGNKTISNNEGSEYLDLIDMIFQQEETAKFICRKLYRWFLYYEITDQIETDIIAPLAQILIANNFEVKPVLRELLGSAHFYDQNFIGAQIKSPLDYTIGFFRQLEMKFPNADQLMAQYNLWYRIYLSTNVQLQSITDPPDVAGWKAYYQEPLYYRTWVSSVTLTERNTFTDQMLSYGITQNEVNVKVDPFVIIDQFDSPENPNELVQQFVDLLIPVALSQDQRDDLKESLIPGLPDFEWTIEYEDYLNHSTDETKKNAVKAKLLALLTAIKNLPQFQLG